MSRLASWLPPIAWMAVIAGFSTDAGSADHTGTLLLTLARLLVPSLTPQDLAALHHVVRKLAHFAVYAVLAALWWRALVQERRLSPGRAAWIALAVSLAWAMLDETHQAFEASRTGSAVDVAIDGAGAAAAVALIRHGLADAMAAVTLLALWAAAVGGGVMLVVDGMAGLPAGLLWVTTAAAAVVLAGDHWRRRRLAG